MASNPYILTDVDEVLVYAGTMPDPEFEGEEAPTDPAIVFELNDGEAVAQLFLTADGARELARRLSVAADSFEREERLARIATVYPEAAAEARMAGTRKDA